MVPLLEADAPSVNEGVGLGDTVLLPLSVVDGVAGGVPLHVAVGEPDGVPEPVWEGVAELLNDWLAVFEANAPAVREPVGDADTVLLRLAVVLIV